MATTYQLNCRACGASNRIPAEKEGLSGHCGSCRAPLPPLYLHPRQVTDRDFETFIASFDGPVLAEFWAPW